MKKKDWQDITLGLFLKIRDIIEVKDEYVVLNLLDLIYGIDSASLPITEFSKYKDALEFLNKDVPVVNLKEKYEINGTVYNSGYNLSEISAAQFIDYQNYTKENRFEDYLSVFFIPEGHKYNDGYDMNKVKKDLLDLDFPTVKSICFFFTMQSQKLYQAFLSSLKRTVKKKVKDKEKRKEIIKKLEILELDNLELYL